MKTKTNKSNHTDKTVGSSPKFCLSEKIMFQMGDEELIEDEVITIGDVKEFIRLLKEEIDKLGIQQTGIHRGFLKLKIDVLAGSKLNGNEEKQ